MHKCSMHYGFVFNTLSNEKKKISTELINILLKALQSLINPNVVQGQDKKFFSGKNYIDVQHVRIFHEHFWMYHWLGNSPITWLGKAFPVFTHY